MKTYIKKLKQTNKNYILRVFTTRVVSLSFFCGEEEEEEEEKEEEAEEEEKYSVLIRQGVLCDKPY